MEFNGAIIDERTDSDRKQELATPVYDLLLLSYKQELSFF